MADRDYTGNRQDVHLEDVVEVGSRVSWGAILAGAVMALATCFVLNLVGQAVGVSISHRTDATTLGTSAAVWAVITSMVGLFVGGWVTSQCVVGETKTESVVHGIIMWGVALAFMLWGTATGINASFTGMMKVASIAGVTTEPGSQQGFQTTSSSAIPQEYAQRAIQPRDNNDANNDRATATAAGGNGAMNNNGAMANNGAMNNNSNGRHASAPAGYDDIAARATWWTLANTVLSIVSAIVGSSSAQGLRSV